MMVGVDDWSQFARAVCDDKGVDLSLYKSDYTARDLHHSSSLFSRASGIQTSVVAAGRGTEVFGMILRGGPVMKVKIIQLRGGGTLLSMAVAHQVIDGRTCMKVRGVLIGAIPLLLLASSSAPVRGGGRYWSCGLRRPGGFMTPHYPLSNWSCSIDNGLII